jgi:hypothetical protein
MRRAGAALGPEWDSPEDEREEEDEAQGQDDDRLERAHEHGGLAILLRLLHGPVERVEARVGRLDERQFLQARLRGDEQDAAARRGAARRAGPARGRDADASGPTRSRGPPAPCAPAAPARRRPRGAERAGGAPIRRRARALATRMRAGAAAPRAAHLPLGIGAGVHGRRRRAGGGGERQRRRNCQAAREPRPGERATARPCVRHGCAACGRAMRRVLSTRRPLGGWGGQRSATARSVKANVGAGHKALLAAAAVLFSRRI